MGEASSERSEFKTKNILFAVLFLTLFALQALLAMRHFNATFDEGTHLTSGYTYLQTGEILLNQQHPPLIKILAALPLLSMDLKLNLYALTNSAHPPNEWEYATAFMYDNDADQLLWYSRSVIVGLGVLLGIYVFAWATILYGETGGLLSLLIYTFSPNMIAHSHLVTMDVGLALFSVAALFHFWRYHDTERFHEIVFCGIALALALATKFSALILLLSIFILMIVRMYTSREDFTSKMFTFITTFFTLFFFSAFILYAVYFFPDNPFAYIEGIQRVNADHNASYPAYLFGYFQVGGFWAYFLAAFLVKTPVVTVVLLLCALVSAWIPPCRFSEDEIYLLVPVFLFVAITTLFADNYGVRYILPVYPMLFIFISRLLHIPTGTVVNRWIVLTVLFCYYTVASVTAFPDYLSYFNEAVGGKESGHLYLDDSNIDWGQDLKRLKAKLDYLGIKEIKLLYNRPALPEYYGISWQPLTAKDWKLSPSPGVYVIGTHSLIRGLYQHEQGMGNTDWLRRYAPNERVGGSFFIYYF